MAAERLWESLARELLTSDIGDKRAKYLAWLSSTTYHNPRGIKVMILYPVSYSTSCLSSCS